MAFLHRVVNGDGTLEREYAIGSDRMDLCLRYKDVTLGIELKVWREKKRDPLTEGISQLESYLGRLGLDFGWLYPVRIITYNSRMYADKLKTLPLCPLPLCPPAALMISLYSNTILFVFDRRKNALPMEERLSTEVVMTQNQRAITVIRA